MAKLRKVPRGFFIPCHPIAMALSVASFYLLLMAWVWPAGVPIKLFGHLSDLVFYVGTTYNQHMMILFLCAVLLHIVEAVVALVLCMRMKLKKGVTALWFFQTLIFGIFSLHYLLFPQAAIANNYSD